MTLPSDSSMQAGSPAVALRAEAMLHPEQPARSGLLARLFTGSVLAVWVPLLLVVGASLMVGHWVALPTPAKDDGILLASLADTIGDEHDGTWRMVHVLYSECPCSRRILDGMLREPRDPEVHETVLVVGEDQELPGQLRAAGFGVLHTTREELAERWHIESAPLLLILDPSGELAYLGGYTERKQGLAVKHRDYLQRLQTDDDVESLPVYGCGVSQPLQDALDPLGLKY